MIAETFLAQLRRLCANAQIHCALPILVGQLVTPYQYLLRLEQFSCGYLITSVVRAQIFTWGAKG